MSLAEEIRARERALMEERARAKRQRRRERRKALKHAKWVARKRRKGAQRRVLAPACEACGVDQRHGLCRHHLVPIAQGGGNERENVVTLCHRCHATAHTIWGPGHAYAGPGDRELFLQRLREYGEGAGFRFVVL